jgi:hypothetical protein
MKDSRLARAVVSNHGRHGSNPRCGLAELFSFLVADNGCGYTITSSDVQTLLRQAGIAAHPNAAHHLQLHIDGLMVHSLRVTAAVALFNAPVPSDVMA